MRSSFETDILPRTENPMKTIDVLQTDTLCVRNLKANRSEDLKCNHHVQQADMLDLHHMHPCTEGSA